jgi:copper(I)-binding protein
VDDLATEHERTSEFVAYRFISSAGAEVADASKVSSSRFTKMWPTLSYARRLSNRDRRIFIGAASLPCLLVMAVWAKDAASADVAVEHARCAPTAPGATVGACTLLLRNLGGASDRLVAVEAHVARRVEIHVTTMTDGIMRMRPMSQGVEIAAGESVDFRARGYHLMLLELQAPLAPEETVEATLIFARAGAERAVFRIDQRR